MIYSDSGDDGRRPWQLQSLYTFRQDNRSFINETVNSGQGNLTDSWITGGAIADLTRVSTVQRVIFAQDTSTSTTRGSLSLPVQSHTTNGNTTDAWTVYGNDFVLELAVYYTNVDRIIFASDTNAALPKAKVFRSSVVGDSQGNISQTWILPRLFSDTEFTDTVERIQHNNDTITALIRANLGLSQGFRHSASGNSTDTWLAGGRGTGDPVTSISRYTYATDLSQSQVRQQLSTTREQCVSSSNATDQWIMHGTITGTTGITTIERIIFSNDTALTSIRANVPANITVTSSGGNSTDMWSFGGRDPVSQAIRSNMDRLTFANDTASTSVRGSTSVPIRSHSSS